MWNKHKHKEWQNLIVNPAWKALKIPFLSQAIVLLYLYVERNLWTPLWKANWHMFFGHCRVKNVIESFCSQYNILFFFFGHYRNDKSLRAYHYHCVMRQKCRTDEYWISPPYLHQSHIIVTVIHTFAMLSLQWAKNFSQSLYPLVLTYVRNFEKCLSLSDPSVCKFYIMQIEHERATLFVAIRKFWIAAGLRIF